MNSIAYSVCVCVCMIYNAHTHTHTSQAYKAKGPLNIDWQGLRLNNKSTNCVQLINYNYV